MAMRTFPVLRPLVVTRKKTISNRVVKKLSRVILEKKSGKDIRILVLAIHHLKNDYSEKIEPEIPGEIRLLSAMQNTGQS